MLLCEFMINRLGAFPQPDCCQFLTELHLFLSGLPLTLFDTLSNRMLGFEDEVCRFLSDLRLCRPLRVVESGVGEQPDGFGLGPCRCRHPRCLLSLFAEPLRFGPLLLLGIPCPSEAVDLRKGPEVGHLQLCVRSVESIITCSQGGRHFSSRLKGSPLLG